jgi:hypothetical protein
MIRPCCADLFCSLLQLKKQKEQKKITYCWSAQPSHVQLWLQFLFFYIIIYISDDYIKKKTIFSKKKFFRFFGHRGGSVGQKNFLASNLLGRRFSKRRIRKSNKNFFDFFMWTRLKKPFLCPSVCPTWFDKATAH